MLSVCFRLQRPTQLPKLLHPLQTRSQQVPHAGNGLDRSTELADCERARLHVSDLGEQRIPAVARQQPDAHFLQHGFRRDGLQQGGYRSSRGFAELLAGLLLEQRNPPLDQPLGESLGESSALLRILAKIKYPLWRWIC